MNLKSRSIRSFIGSKNFALSSSFYSDLGFEQIKIDPKFSYFKIDENIGFYLQDAYVKDWINNSMLFLEVEDVSAWHIKISSLGLKEKYKTVRISSIVKQDWGEEFFMHDPVGVLWHIGKFKD